MLANLLNVAGVNHVITLDLHSSQMQGFFKCPVDNLIAEPLISKWIRLNVPDWPESVVVSKNPGGTKRATSLADALKLSFGIVTTDRRRPHMPPSMFNSTLFESMTIDGNSDLKSLQEEDAEIRTYPGSKQPAPPIETDFASLRLGQRNHGTSRDQQPRKTTPTRHRGYSNILSSTPTRLVNGNSSLSSESAPSPLAHSTHVDATDDDDTSTDLRRATTIPGITKPLADEDGYEEPGGEDDGDEAGRRRMAANAPR